MAEKEIDASRSGTDGPPDNNEAVTVTRAMIMAGILVGISGRNEPVPSQVQLDRATDLIMRAGRKRQGEIDRLVVALDDTKEGW